MSEKHEGGSEPTKDSIPKIPVPTIPDFASLMPKIPTFEFPDIKIPPNPLVTSVEANYASAFYERLVEWINRFNESLDEEHEVGVKLVSFGQTVVFHLEDLGYWNPSLISFKGKTDDGNPVELIQHVTQISILLNKLPRKNPREPKKKIGFHEDDPDVA